MKVLIAPDKFKGTLSALEAASAMADGVLRVYPDAHVQLLPVADGGEGTLEAALAAGAAEHSERVVGPLDREVTASWAMLEHQAGKTAVIETARASGLLLTEPSVQSALAAHSYGSGQLIEAALNAGATEIVLGVGGSAMTDGGSGALRALGLKVYHDGGAEVLLGGAALATAQELDATGLDRRLAETVIRVAADVANPLHGPDGAAHAFGGQKGADAASRRLLDEALQRWAQLLLQATGRDVNVAGAGAAGGFPSGFMALAGVRLERGFDVVADLVGLDTAMADADLVLTGEGSLDRQSEFGKAPLGVAGRARSRGIPAVVIAGRISLSPDRLAEHGVHAASSLVEVAGSQEEAMAHAARYVTLATQQALEGA